MGQLADGIGQVAIVFATDESPDRTISQDFQRVSMPWLGWRARRLWSCLKIRIPQIDADDLNPIGNDITTYENLNCMISQKSSERYVRVGP